jgi:hypothetical protein
VTSTARALVTKFGHSLIVAMHRHASKLAVVSSTNHHTAINSNHVACSMQYKVRPCTTYTATLHMVLISPRKCGVAA